VVDRAVAADQARAVEAEADGRPCSADLLEGLVERPLQEGRVDREEGLEPGLGEPRHHVHRVALADAGVPRAVGELVDDGVMPVPSGIAAVHATTDSSRAIRSSIASPKAR
jgi:hypothetical protein